jgi:hypothetical protein
MSKPPSPEAYAASGTEDGAQIALFIWAQQNLKSYPELELMLAIPNGGSRHKAEAAKLKAMGVKVGVSDILLPVCRGRWSGLWIELKRPASVGKVKGVISDEQSEWIAKMKLQYFDGVVCYGWIEARDKILEYLK